MRTGVRIPGAMPEAWEGFGGCLLRRMRGRTLRAAELLSASASLAADALLRRRMLGLLLSCFLASWLWQSCS